MGKKHFFPQYVSTIYLSVHPATYLATPTHTPSCLTTHAYPIRIFLCVCVPFCVLICSATNVSAWVCVYKNIYIHAYITWNQHFYCILAYVAPYVCCIHFYMNTDCCPLLHHLFTAMSYFMLLLNTGYFCIGRYRLHAFLYERSSLYATLKCTQFGPSGSNASAGKLASARSNPRPG